VAAFGLVDALLFRPLPVRNPDELARLSSAGVDGALSYRDYLEYREARSFRGLAGFTAATLTLHGPGDASPARVSAYLVTDGYFDVLGVPAALGRVPRADDAPSVVLSDRFWRRRFDADPAALGRAVTIDGRAFTLAAVAPPGFGGTIRGGAPDLFVPLTGLWSREQLVAGHGPPLIVTARLERSAALEAAGAEVAAISARLRAAQGLDAGRGTATRLGPEATALIREVPQLAYVAAAVIGIFGLLLAVASVNLAALLTARATFRAREIVIRLMHGAGSGAIAAQLVTESVILAAIGGAAGVAVGVLGRQWLWSRLQAGTAGHLGVEALAVDAGLDARMLVFAVAASAVAVVLFGLLPAWQASKADLYLRAAEHAAPPPRHRARLRRLLAVQLALCTVLVGGGGLLLRVLHDAARLDLGYPVAGQYVADLDLSSIARTARAAALERLVTGMRSEPGVQGAALAAVAGPAYLPPAMTPGRPPQNYVLSVCGPRYFETLGIPILLGRDFDAGDARGAPPVAIVNQRLAEALWPGQSPLGRRIAFTAGGDGPTVVGLVKTVRAFPVGPPFFMIYLPLAQREADEITVHLRGEATAVTRIEEAARRSHPGLAVFRARPLADWAGAVLAVPTTLAGVLAALGLAGLLLSAVGLYGLTAYLALRRTRECAIRSALGARPAELAQLLVRDGAVAVLAGLGIGSLGLVAVGLALRAVLLGSAFDASILVTVPLLLAAVALAAAIVPAWRAGSVEPAVALREP
jgi:predicted permease